jgi:myo-inositol-1(or 4)-monophosphatase
VARSAIIHVMTSAALKAARGLVRDFGEVEQLQVSRKGPADFVSTADHKAERTLRAELSKARAGFGFLMEESGETQGADERHRWIVDPLDGTTNFLHGIPHFCISLGLERDGEIVAGVVYDPTRDEMFWAEKGIGAYMNDRRLRVSGRTKLDDAVIATGIPYRGRGDHESYLETLGAVMGTTAGVRRMGAAALDLVYVAAGRDDGYWEFGLNAWDIAAGMLIVREAGGQVSDAGGGPDPIRTGEIVASSVPLHPALAALVRKGARRAA